MNKLYKMISEMKRIAQFAEQCPQGKRGRPLSGSSVQKLGDENICEKKRKDGETIYYKTSGQIEKDKKEKDERREERKKIGAKSRGRFSKLSLSLREELRNKLKDAVIKPSSTKPVSKQKKQTKEKEQPQPKPQLKRKAEKKESSVPEQKIKSTPAKEIEPKIKSNSKLTTSSSESETKLKDAKKAIKSIAGESTHIRTQAAANIMAMTSGLSLDESKKIIENEFPRGGVNLTEEDAGGNWIEAVKSAVSKIPPDRNALLDKEIKDSHTDLIKDVKEKSNGWRRMAKIDVLYDVVKDRVPDITDSEFIAKLYDLALNDKISLAPVTDMLDSEDNKFVFPMRFGGELAFVR